MARTAAKAAPSEPTLETLQEEIAKLKKANRDQRISTVTIARKYAEQHNLCSVVDQALKEAGLLGESITKVVTMNVPVEITIEVDKELFEEASEEDIKKMVGEIRMTSATWNNPHGAVASVAQGRMVRKDSVRTVIGAPEVVNVGDTATMAAAVLESSNSWARPPRDYLALYSRPEGRKIHFVKAAEFEYSGRTTRVTVDGVEFNAYNSPLCGQSFWSYAGTRWQATSPRAILVGTEQGICTGCRDVAYRSFGRARVAR